MKTSKEINVIYFTKKKTKKTLLVNVYTIFNGI